jgi:hypothetical protein
MIAHCFREKKKRSGGIEKNRSDHFNANLQPPSVMSSVGSHDTNFCLAKYAQYALHDRVR